MLFIIIQHKEKKEMPYTEIILYSHNQTLLDGDPVSMCLSIHLLAHLLIHQTPGCPPGSLPGTDLGPRVIKTYRLRSLSSRSLQSGWRGHICK